MKMKFLFSCLLIFIGFTANAQEETSTSSSTNSESLIKYGFKVGYDMSPITFKPVELLDQFKNGYQGGVFLQIGRTIYFQPEIYYASYGASTNKIKTFRVPLLLGLRIINLGIVSLHLMGGPVYNAYTDDVQGGVKPDNVWNNWQAGAGVDILGFITADVRYNIKKNIDLYDQIKNFDMQNDMLNVTVGLKLR